MNSAFGFVIGLLQAALALLGFVQQQPNLPQASRDQAQQIAQQAITQATQALASSFATTGHLSTIPSNSISVPSATIDQSSLWQPSDVFYITGSASSTNGLTVFLVPANYSTYASIADYKTIAGHSEKDGFFHVPAAVANGRWTTAAPFALFINSGGSFLVLVFDAASKTLLASDTVTVANNYSGTE